MAIVKCDMCGKDAREHWRVRYGLCEVQLCGACFDVYLNRYPPKPKPITQSDLGPTAQEVEEERHPGLRRQIREREEAMLEKVREERDGWLS